MAQYHTVLQGEHLSRIAEQYGFRDYRTIWGRSENEALRASRDTPHVLFPGDQVFIPDKQAKQIPAATDRSHVFVAPNPKLKLFFVLLDFDNKPLANVECELEIEDQLFQLRTSGAGQIDVEVPISAETGVLRCPALGLERAISIGHLDPHDEDNGWLQRLVNLGYLDGAEADDSEQNAAAVRDALEEFQCDRSLKVTGEIDDATQGALKDLHGC